MTPVVVTGVAGFIGYHLAARCLADGRPVLGVDAVTDSYDPALKEARLAALAGRPGFTFARVDLADADRTNRLLADARPSIVAHLAAETGVRKSPERAPAYVQSNLVAFANVLEASRRAGVRHLVYASSSSVYGLSARVPFDEHGDADHPASLYGATKRAGELLAHAYASAHGLPCTGLRFFTVYGPWGRPDMAPWRFTEAMLAGRPVEVYGDTSRAFTYVDDVVEAVTRVLDHPPRADVSWDARACDPATSRAPWRVYNVGHPTRVPVIELVRALERALGVPAEIRQLPMQSGDLVATAADVTDLSAAFGHGPSTPLEVGISTFVEWYRSHVATRGDRAS